MYRSHIYYDLLQRRILKKVRAPFLGFMFFWALWLSQQIYALANVPHVTNILH